VEDSVLSNPNLRVVHAGPQWIKLHRKEYAGQDQSGQVDTADGYVTESAPAQAHCYVPAWSNFSFDREQILQHLQHL
jgi:hypothetical protein